MFNRLGLCIRYDDLEGVDIAFTQEIINFAGTNRVPVSKYINSSPIVHDAMDNFDHEENTLSRIGGSHDTILVLFQKPGMKDTTEKISTKSANICGCQLIKEVEVKLSIVKLKLEEVHFQVVVLFLLILNQHSPQI